MSLEMIHLPLTPLDHPTSPEIHGFSILPLLQACREPGRGFSSPPGRLAQDIRSTALTQRQDLGGSLPAHQTAAPEQLEIRYRPVDVNGPRPHQLRFELAIDISRL